MHRLEPVLDLSLGSIFADYGEPLDVGGDAHAIETCPLNDVDDEAWLPAVLAHIGDHPN